MKTSDLSVGEFAARAGVPVSTLHYYESEGLIESWRNAGNHRRFDRRELRRVAIVRIAQSVGVSLAEVRAVLSRIPRDRPVSAAQWAAAAAPWRAMLDARIEAMTRLRDQMGYCIGCGCLSLESCPLYNADDRLGANGPGARRWIGTPGERVAPGG
jgi:MerR family redox-sensitive transcriptional activator SoxR